MNSIKFSKPFIFVTKKRLKIDVFIILTIVICPFAFYFYTIIPNDIKVWKTSWFSIDSGFHDDLRYYIWILFVKFLTLIILSVWYLTCQYNWKQVIFLPISFEIYKLGILFSIEKYGYEYEFPKFDSLYYSIPYILILLLISKMLKYEKKESSLMLNQHINNELQNLSIIDKRHYQRLKRELSDLHKNANNLTQKEYLIKLLSIRDRLLM